MHVRGKLYFFACAFIGACIGLSFITTSSLVLYQHCITVRHCCITVSFNLNFTETLRIRAFEQMMQHCNTNRPCGPKGHSDCVFYPYFQGFMEGRSLLVVYGFYFSPTLPRGPPWNEGHWPKVRHETSVLKVPAQEQQEHSFCSSSTNAFISYSIYTVRRNRTSLGAPDLRVRLGCLQGSTRNGMWWGHARSTGDSSQ